MGLAVRTGFSGGGALHLNDRLADGVLLWLRLLGTRPQPAEAVWQSSATQGCRLEVHAGMFRVPSPCHASTLWRAGSCIVALLYITGVRTVPEVKGAHLTPVYRMTGTPCWSTAQHPDQHPFSSGPPAEAVGYQNRRDCLRASRSQSKNGSFIVFAASVAIHLPAYLASGAAQLARAPS